MDEEIKYLAMERFSMEQTICASTKRSDELSEELAKHKEDLREIYAEEPGFDMLDSSDTPSAQCKRLLGLYFTPTQTDILVGYFETRGLFTAPASTKYHGNWQGGLWEHSLCVARELMKLSHRLNLQWQNGRSPALVGLCHDLCKCRLYKKDSFTGNYISIKDEFNKGHGNYSVTILREALSLIGLKPTEEEELCIRYHMGAYTDLTSKEYVQKEWAELRQAIEKYPTVLYTHTADMIASSIRGT